MSVNARVGGCKICRREDCAAIDAQLVLGRPLRAIAAQFVVPRATLHTHSKHVSGIVQRAVTHQVQAYARDLHHSLREAQREVLMILRSARTSGHSLTALKAAAELRAILEVGRKLLAKSTDAKANGKAKAPAEPPEVEIVYEEEPHAVA